MQAIQQTIAVFVAEYVPENYFRVIDLQSLFPRSVPLEVDLGCGDGSFLAALAQGNPQRNFLGVERLRARVRSASRKIEHENLGNARVLRVEISYAVAYLLPPNSVSVFYLLFPDPWPKRRHQRRRIVTEEFLETIHRALAVDGSLVIATDQREYFEEVKRKSEQMRKFLVEPINDVLPETTFERHFVARGLEIHRLALRKVSPVR